MLFPIQWVTFIITIYLVSVLLTGLILHLKKYYLNFQDDVLYFLYKPEGFYILIVHFHLLIFLYFSKKNWILNCLTTLIGTIRFVFTALGIAYHHENTNYQIFKKLSNLALTYHTSESDSL